MKRRRLIVLMVVAALCVPIGRFLVEWRQGVRRGGQKYAEPFRIAGNFYYVGANDVTSFLITGPEGHILIDGGYPETPKLIMASVARLGFRMSDVKLILNSEPHYDHAGGLAELQKVSGAHVWASDPSANALEGGGYDRDLNVLMGLWTRVFSYQRVHVDHRFKDGDTIRVGSTAIVAHITGGHTRGCTTYSFPVRDGDRVLHVVSACSLVMLKFTGYTGFRADFERTFRVLRSLPADIWVTSHGRLWGRYRKFAARDSAKNPVDAFIDPEGYRAYVDSGEARFRRGEMH